jgi:hypothetical protein
VCACVCVRVVVVVVVVVMGGALNRENIVLFTGRDSGGVWHRADQGPE